MQRVILVVSVIILIFGLFGCAKEELAKPFPTENNPWPRIRRERIKTLLPDAMRRAGADLWLTICRENNNDPLAMFVGGENAGQPAAFMFFLEADTIRSLAISPQGEATALKDVGLHENVITIERGSSLWQEVSSVIERADPKHIAVNSSGYNIADGLSHTQRTELENALAPVFRERLVPSDLLVKEWLSVKLPEEIAIMKKAAAITVQLQIDAYKTVVPGKTTDADVARYLKNRMAELGVTDAWAPEQNPNVNSGPDRGHSHATDKVIQPGDVIQTDFGIKVYDIWCSDIQRFAYVLRPGEHEPPDEIKDYLKKAITGHRKVLAAMRPGVSGWSADKVQRDWLAESGSLPVMWGTGHPVGYWAHDAGPSLGGASYWHQPFRDNALLLRSGQVFAYDGFYTWEREDGSTKTISVEEMAVITDQGAEYLSEPQEEWFLIKSQ